MKKLIHHLSKTLGYILVFCLVLQLSTFSQSEHGTKNKQLSSMGLAKTGIIHREVDFVASPKQLYALLLNSKQFSEMTALAGGFSPKSAQIDSAVGGTFVLFDGHIIGRNIELVHNQLIVQVWRVVDWPVGVYSIVRFEFKPTTSGTRLVFDHTAFPEKMQDDLAKGWQSHYWDLMAKYFAKK